jgi:hypothetical protein
MTIYLLLWWPDKWNEHGRVAKLKCKEVGQLAYTAVATLALLVATGTFAEAGNSPKERSIELITKRTAGEPIMAIVSLRSQRITVYDADGWIMRAPVSSGQAGRETPAGIFSVIQKDAEHHSNLYDDAYMPHMQRLTRSGIALHGGLLPDIRPRTGAFVCRTTLLRICSILLSWACA